MAAKKVKEVSRNQRQSNIELLRIVLMLMVIGVHYNAFGMGNAFEYVEKFSGNAYILYFFESICIVGVNVYVIITGYFMVESNKIKISKVIYLIASVVFYNILMYGLEILTGLNSFSLSELLKNVITGKWFITIYIVLYMLSPFLNILLNRLSAKGFKIYLLILFIVFSVWPTALEIIFDVSNRNVPVGLSSISANGGEMGYSIVNFIVFYSIGAYIKKYHKKGNCKFFAVFFVLNAILITIISKASEMVWNYNNVLVLINSVLLFLIFSNFKLPSNKIINKVSELTLAVFIIHTSDFMNEIWNKLQVEKFCNTNLVILHFCCSIIIVFVCCCAIDLICRPLINRIVISITRNIRQFQYEINIEDII